MLNKILKNILIVAPVLLTGVFFSNGTFAQNEPNEQIEQVKPNIHQLTGEKTAQKVNKDIPDASQRIPGRIHKHSLGFGVGQTFLRSDLATNGNDKITGELYYNYSASYTFDFVANLHYSKHTYLNREATIKGLALAIKAKGFQLDAFSPFVLGGFGFYLPSVTRVQNGVPTKTRSQLVFGANVGAGVELRLNDQATVGVMVHYHDPFDVRLDDGQILESSYLKLLMMASYTFN
jgi:opacity protein-like surface antigen